MHTPLINFIFHLNYEKKTVFANWVLLNQAVIDELGPDVGLRQITRKSENQAIFRELESPELKPGFMGMNDKEE